jgi:hypothetical protein
MNTDGLTSAHLLPVGVGLLGQERFHIGPVMRPSGAPAGHDGQLAKDRLTRAVAHAEHVGELLPVDEPGQLSRLMGGDRPSPPKQKWRGRPLAPLAEHADAAVASPQAAPICLRNVSRSKYWRLSFSVPFS